MQRGNFRTFKSGVVEKCGVKQRDGHAATALRVFGIHAQEGTVGVSKGWSGIAGPFGVFVVEQVGNAHQRIQFLFQFDSRIVGQSFKVLRAQGEFECMESREFSGWIKAIGGRPIPQSLVVFCIAEKNDVCFLIHWRSCQFFVSRGRDAVGNSLCGGAPSPVLAISRGYWCILELQCLGLRSRRSRAAPKPKYHTRD